MKIWVSVEIAFSLFNCEFFVAEFGSLLSNAILFPMVLESRGVICKSFLQVWISFRVTKSLFISHFFAEPVLMHLGPVSLSQMWVLVLDPLAVLLLVHHLSIYVDSLHHLVYLNLVSFDGFNQVLLTLSHWEVE